MAVGIGIVGAGVVGGTLVRRLTDEHEVVTAKTGLDLEVRKVAVRSLTKDRPFTLAEGVLTDRPLDLIGDPSIDLIVEVMGGTDPAGDLVLGALEAGKPVVTANKELIAARGRELIAAASRRVIIRLPSPAGACSALERMATSPAPIAASGRFAPNAVSRDSITLWRTASSTSITRSSGT